MATESSIQTLAPVTANSPVIHASEAAPASLHTLEAESQTNLNAARALFDLEEQRKKAEFEREVRREELAHTRTLELQENEIRQLERREQIKGEKIQSIFKMLVSLSAMGLGAFFVYKGNQDMGYFLLGGGMASTTSNVTELMRVSKEK